MKYLFWLIWVLSASIGISSHNEITEAIYWVGAVTFAGIASIILRIENKK